MNFYFGFWIKRSEALMWQQGSLTDLQLLERKDDFKPHEVYWIGSVRYEGWYELVRFLKKFDPPIAFRTSSEWIVKVLKKESRKVVFSSAYFASGTRYIVSSGTLFK